MVLSRGAVQKIIKSGRTCSHDNAPDDMFLGSTAKVLNIDIVSSSLFHQVRHFIKYLYITAGDTIDTAI